MKSSKYLWGLILIIIGILLLFSNLDWLSVDWEFLMKMWPLIFIFWGISYLPGKLQVVATIICTLIIAVIIFYSLRGDSGDWLYEFRNKNEASSGEVWDGGDPLISEPYDMQLDYARLDLEAAAGMFVLDKTTDKLIEVKPSERWGKFSMNRRRLGDTDQVTLKIGGRKVKLDDISSENKVHLKLNTKPVWVLNLDFGAAAAELDLSAYKISRLLMDAGASGIDLRLGAHLPESRIKLDAGASAVRLEIPRTAGCQVYKDSGFSRNTFEDFQKKDDRTFETPGFDTATRQIMVSIKSGLSDIEIERY